MLDENIILIADPRVLAVSVQENHDPLINIAEQGDIGIGPPPLVANNVNYTYMRKTVYEKLCTAQSLLPSGLKFCLYEAYRSFELQQQIFDERYHKLKSENPHLSHEEIFTEATKFVSPVTNLDGSRNIPPHTTGAAIDVYLVDDNGNFVDMGIHLDDTYNDLHADYCRTDSQLISTQAKAHRKIMSEVLTKVGFVNYPTEYWHWSYGDRYWAYSTQQKFAIYNCI